MSIAPEILEAMKDAGASIDVILAAIRADQALADKATEERRAKDRERQRRHRLSRDVTVTPRDGCDPPPKEVQSPPRFLPTKPSGLEPKPKKHRLPSDWEPKPFTPGTMAAQTVLRWEPGRLERELSKFRDHHTAAGSRFECWQAAWSKWVNNSEDFQRGRSGQQQIPGLGKTSAAIAGLGDWNDDRPM